MKDWGVKVVGTNDDPNKLKVQLEVLEAISLKSNFIAAYNVLYRMNYALSKIKSRICRIARSTVLLLFSLKISMAIRSFRVISCLFLRAISSRLFTRGAGCVTLQGKEDGCQRAQRV